MSNIIVHAYMYNNVHVHVCMIHVHVGATIAMDAALNNTRIYLQVSVLLLVLWHQPAWPVACSLSPYTVDYVHLYNHYCAVGIMWCECVLCVYVCVLGLGYIKKEEQIHEHRTYTQTQECGRLLSASLRTTAQASK